MTSDRATDENPFRAPQYTSTGQLQWTPVDWVDDLLDPKESLVFEGASTWELERDWHRALIRALRKRNRYVLIAIGIAALYSAVALYRTGDTTFALICVFAIGAVALALVRVQHPKQFWKRNFGKSGMAGPRRIRVLLGEKGVQQQLSGRTSIYRWNAFDGYLVTSSSMLLVMRYATMGGAFVLPREWAKTEDQWRRASDLIVGRLSPFSLRIPPRSELERA